MAKLTTQPPMRFFAKVKSAGLKTGRAGEDEIGTAM